jgi:hypothetical protein
VTASVLSTSPTAQAALIQTVKTCLTADEDARSKIDVTITSIADSTRRLAVSKKGSNSAHVMAGAGGVLVDFDIQFDVAEQNFASANEGYSSMSDAFTGAAVSGTFTEILHEVASSPEFMDTTMQDVDGSTDPPVVSTPSVTTVDSAPDDKDDEEVLSDGEIAAVVICGVGFLVLVVLAAMYLSGGMSASTSTGPAQKAQPTHEQILQMNSDQKQQDMEIGISVVPTSQVAVNSASRASEGVAI